MKKLFLNILGLLLSFLLVISCKQQLDVPPQNIIQDKDIFSNESAITAYFVSLYNDLPIEDFNFSAYNGFNAWANAGGMLPNLTDESIANQTDNPNGIGGGTALGWWAYGPVRNVNAFIEKIPGSSFNAEQKSRWLGEAKFIRAYYYFGMVKRYGGIPLITSVQNFTGDNLEELKIPRNTEKEVYDFIAKELDEAAQLLGNSNDKSRANAYVAYALKARAMLYAASISKYGTVQLNGLIGIPASEANTYWQASFDAAKKIIDGGKYSLYNKNADKTQNFQDLFLDVDNPEALFVRYFKYPQKAHSYDLWNLPYEVRSPDGYSSRINPTVELVQAYEYIDGSAGDLKLTDAQGQPIEYNLATDLFKNKDPRFGATVIYPFTQWRGAEIDVQAGVIDNGQTITAGDYKTLYDPVKHAIDNNTGTIHVIGANGIGGGGGEVSQTGFYVRKYLNPKLDRSQVHGWQSDQQFIEMRYAEVLLNYAEAAIELGKTSEAKWALNEIRGRAGIKALDDADVTINRLRNERRVELAFEPFRYWDIRRWRIADKVLNNYKAGALLPYLVLKNNTYIFKTTQVGYLKTFTTNMYYERIDPGEISKNSKLIQNPGY